MAVNISSIRRDPESFRDNPALINIRRRLFERGLQIEKDISATNEQIASEDRKKSAIYKALAFNAENASIILLKNTQAALNKVKEYGDYPLFRDGLLLAIKTDDIISARLTEGTIRVDIDMDRAAGSLDNYAQAVKLARKLIGAKGKGDPFRASIFWFRNIYGPGRLGTKVIRKRKNKETGTTENIDVTEKYVDKYDQTISARLSRFAGGKQAPWWKILEFGNATVQLKSDRGGVGLPFSPPTHFVSASKRQIEEILKGSYQVELKKEIDVFKRKLEKLKRQRQQNEEDKMLVNELLSGKGKTRQEAALEKVRQRLQERYQETQADYRKIEILIGKLASGERVDRVRLGRGIRIRVIQILNELNLEYKDLER